MKVLELFCGTKSFTKVAEEKGCESFTIDLLREFEPDLVKDMLDVKAEDIPFKPDIIWVSPPCKTWSIASCVYHWNKDGTPKTKNAEIGEDMLKHTIALIKELKPKYFFIENPRGLMRKNPVFEDLPHIRRTITYCKYKTEGETIGNFMKPTDIWTNFLEWKPRKMCKPGDSCHTPSPRGKQTGLKGLKNWKKKIIVPKKLCEEIMDSILIKEEESE